MKLEFSPPIMTWPILVALVEGGRRRVVAAAPYLHHVCAVLLYRLRLVMHERCGVACPRQQAHLLFVQTLQRAVCYKNPRAWEVRGLEWDEGEQGMKGGGVGMPARSFAMPWRRLQGSTHCKQKRNGVTACHDKKNDGDCC